MIRLWVIRAASRSAASYKPDAGMWRKLILTVCVCLCGSCAPASPQPSSSEATSIAPSSPNRTMRTFAAPAGGDHFGEPAGAGTLRVCRSPENTIRDAVPIATGMTFSDVGVIDQPPERGGGWWLLWVQTTETVALPAGQECVIVQARVVPSEVPANYSDLQPLTRFSVSDRRYFEMLSDGDNLDRNPARLLMNATAQSDFR